MPTTLTPASEKGYVHIEFWGKRTSRNIFHIASVLAFQLGCSVTAREGWDAPTDREGGDESAFTFDIEATPTQYRAFCDALRKNGIRVKDAMLGEPTDDDWDND